MKIVFMGTASFAIPSLEVLLERGFEIAAIVTTPDRPAGRSLTLTESPVKNFADRLDAPILQPEQLNDPFFLKAIAGFKPDAAAVVAFRILPIELFTIPRLGCINLHASLLPQLRGAAPIQWALLQGMEETGVTTFLIERKVDVGRILLQERIPILPDDDAGSLEYKLSKAGARLLAQSLEGVASGGLQGAPQVGVPTSAPKITRETTLIDWRRSSVDIRNQVRAMSPNPGAFTYLEGKVFKIFRARIYNAYTRSPGAVDIAEDATMIIGTGDGALALDEIQLEGRRRMSGSEFLRGRPLPAGTTLHAGRII